MPAMEVAVKEFKALQEESNSTSELMKTYSDMRYELNKLSMLRHRHVVKFVGLLTHPRSFVLEWAPLTSLESIRKNHEMSMDHFCPCTLFLILMQVRGREGEEEEEEEEERGGRGGGGGKGRKRRKKREGK